MNNTTLRQLLDNETPGGKGLLAAEICTKTNRRHGPVDGNCEVCGQAAEQFILQDWLRWHCNKCAIASLTWAFHRTNRYPKTYRTNDADPR